MNWVPVVKIEPDGFEECVCIAVSHPSRLYVTEGGIVTHNTTVDGAGTGVLNAGDEFQQSNLVPGQQRSASGSGVRRITLAIQSARAEISRLGATIEEVGSEAEALQRGIPPGVAIAATPDGRLVWVPSRASGRFMSDAGAAAIVREEVIHLAWFAALRAQHHRSGSTLPFADWARAGQTGMLRDLATTAAGQQAILDAANIYDSHRRANARYGTVQEALAAYAGREHELLGEVSRQLIQLRESGGTSESVFVSAVRKLWRWMSAALDRLRAVARDVGQVSQPLADAIAETERILAGAVAMLPSAGGGVYYQPANLGASYRSLPSAVTELQEGMEWARSTREERTVDGEPVPNTAYDVRTDIAMLEASEAVMDSLSAEGLRGDELMKALRSRNVGGQRLDMDERQILIRHMIQTGRFHELGVSRRELMTLMQEGAGKGAMAMREMREVLDPIERLRQEAEAQTEEAIKRVTGQDADALHGELEVQVMAAQETAVNDELEKLRAEASELRKTLDQHKADLAETRKNAITERLQLEAEIKRLQNLLNLAEGKVTELEARPTGNAEANQRLAEEILQARERATELRREIQDLETALAEETARANQEREVGIAIGREEGRAESDAEWAARQPEAQLEQFEQWLMGERIDGMESVEAFARRHLQASRFDAEGFSRSVMALFPAVDQHIVEDAMDRVSVSFANSAAAARRRKIQEFIDRLAGKAKKAEDQERLGRFLGSLQRASDFGILDRDVFSDAFAHSFELNGMNPAVAQRLLDMWHEINRLEGTAPLQNKNARRVHFGMVRETLEREFLETVNAVAPGARWDNFLFNQFQSAVLSSISSGMNQFSGVFRALAGVDATARLAARGNYNPADVMGEWWRNVSDLMRNLPLILTGLRGESLGHTGPQVRGNFTPMEQQMQHARTHPLKLRLPGGRTVTLPPGLSKLLRAKELYAWRIIRAAEGLSGITDAQARFRDVLTAHFQAQGMRPGQARAAALNAMSFSPTQRQAAEARARAEQAAGRIGTGSAVVKRRAEEILNNELEVQLADELVARAEHLTAAAQFKTMPTGAVGFFVSNIMKSATKPEGAGRAARFFFLFGRFLGHTVDTTLAYTPGLHFATLGRQNGTSPRHKIMEEVFGSVREYNAQQHGKAVAGGAFLLAVGALQALAANMGDDEDEPWFNITGFAPGADPEAKERLKATGQWNEGQIRIGGRPVLNFSQMPELVPLLTIAGNVSDYLRFDSALFRRKAEDGESGTQAMTAGGITAAAAGDVLLAPLKRSTYKQWVAALDSMMKGKPSDSIANIVTSPVGGALRIPLLVDADRIYRAGDGAVDAKGWVENTLRRIPFVQVGDRMFNPYGEQLPGFDAFGMFPSDAEIDPKVQRAAKLNLETRTSRGVPQLTLKYEDGTVKETPREMQEAYVQISGKRFVESLLKNEEAIRRAYETGGQAAAQKVVGNISKKVNNQTKDELSENK